MSQNAYILVIGNEKGGCGKTTLSMHLCTYLLYEGYNVSTVDLDPRQRTLTRYIEQRLEFGESQHLYLPMPKHHVMNHSQSDSKELAQQDEEQRFLKCLSASSKGDVLLIDTPGNHNFLSTLAHSYADIVVTPINDSFLDLDVLAHTHRDSLDMNQPGVYSELIWNAKITKAKRDRAPLEWVVLRNRLSNIDANNKRAMADSLNLFSKRTGARVASGLAERVIYRELFLKGITLLDVLHEKTEVSLQLSHIAARQELRNLCKFLDLKSKIQAKKERLTEKVESSASTQPEKALENA